jgi:two-component system phosphate regulon response regulator OmpR
LSRKILVVDDDRHIADSLRAILKSAGYNAVCTYAATDALHQIPDFQPELIIADVVMPGKTGVELAVEVLRRKPHIPIILLSGNAGTEELLRQAGVELEGVLVLAKPFPPRDLIRIVDDLMRSAAA